jgi:hypothetical protein
MSRDMGYKMHGLLLASYFGEILKSFLTWSFLILQHATIEDLDVSTATSFFGVYDGHGG